MREDAILLVSCDVQAATWGRGRFDPTSFYESPVRSSTVYEATLVLRMNARGLDRLRALLAAGDFEDERKPDASASLALPPGPIEGTFEEEP